jgi:hypothetical protein
MHADEEGEGKREAGGFTCAKELWMAKNFKLGCLRKL